MLWCASFWHLAVHLSYLGALLQQLAAHLPNVWSHKCLPMCCLQRHLASRLSSIVCRCLGLVCYPRWSLRHLHRVAINVYPFESAHMVADDCWCRQLLMSRFPAMQGCCLRCAALHTVTLPYGMHTEHLPRNTAVDPVLSSSSYADNCTVHVAGGGGTSAGAGCGEFVIYPLARQPVHCCCRVVLWWWLSFRQLVVRLCAHLQTVLVCWSC